MLECIALARFLANEKSELFSDCLKKKKEKVNDTGRKLEYV